MKVIQWRKDSLFNKWYWNSLSFTPPPPAKKLNLDLTSKLIQLDHTCKYKTWNHKAVTRKHRTTGSPYLSCFRDKEGSIFFQITLLPCSGYPENAASHLGLALGQGRESQSRRMVFPLLLHSASHKEPLSLVFWLEREGLSWNIFCLHLLCSPWIWIAQKSELGDMEWKKSGNSLPFGLFFRIWSPFQICLVLFNQCLSESQDVCIMHPVQGLLL